MWFIFCLCKSNEESKRSKNVDKQSNVLWNSENYVTKKFWSNSETSTDVQYKYWKFKFLATDHPQYTQYVELSEINLFECEHKVLDGTTSDRAKGSDLITMKATKTTSTNEYFFWFESKTMQTDTNWLCKYASTLYEKKSQYGSVRDGQT